jgi:hypothetical protein
MDTNSKASFMQPRAADVIPIPVLNRVIAVTGASSGPGRATAPALTGHTVNNAGIGPISLLDDLSMCPSRRPSGGDQRRPEAHHGLRSRTSPP